MTSPSAPFAPGLHYKPFVSSNPFRYILPICPQIKLLMEGAMRGLKLTAFGSWNFYGEEEKQGDFVHGHFFVGEGEDLFGVLSPCKLHQPPKMGGVGGDGKMTKAKTVDEDLYKIPPELLYQIPKKKKMVWRFWGGGCLSINCIA